LWYDGRGKQECDALDALLPDPGDRAGIATMPGMTAPKVIWLCKHAPDVFARVKTILRPKNDIPLCLFGKRSRKCRIPQAHCGLMKQSATATNRLSPQDPRFGIEQRQQIFNYNAMF
jgi:sugar (pentulose or hexulose) kinase